MARLKRREILKQRFIKRRLRYTLLHDQGLSYAKIAKRYRISKQRVWQIVNEDNIDRPSLASG
jgi:Mor family transcriptional regulator